MIVCSKENENSFVTLNFTGSFLFFFFWWTWCRMRGHLLGMEKYISPIQKHQLVALKLQHHYICNDIFIFIFKIILCLTYTYFDIQIQIKYSVFLQWQSWCTCNVLLSCLFFSSMDVCSWPRPHCSEWMCALQHVPLTTAVVQASAHPQFQNT